MSKLLTILLFLSISLQAVGQIDLVTEALFNYQNKNLPKAKELIDQAVEDSTYSSQSRTWYFRGYIFKDLYKSDRKNAKAHTYRLESVSSFRTAITLDIDKEYYDDCIQSLHYISSTMYNDAAVALDTGNFSIAVPYYNLYREIMAECNPSMDFTNRDIEFKLFLASKFSAIFEDSTITDKDPELSEKITRLYTEVLALDSNNVGANYNLGIHYYNQAVNIIENLNYELPFEELFAIQESCVVLFQKAEPFMLKAYKLDPKRKAVLIGLSGIYFSLNDIEKSEKYKKELEELEKLELKGPLDDN